LVEERHGVSRDLFHMVVGRQSANWDEAADNVDLSVWSSEADDEFLPEPHRR
jgi:hypothetical protein